MEVVRLEGLLARAEADIAERNTKVMTAGPGHRPPHMPSSSALDLGRSVRPSEGPYGARACDISSLPSLARTSPPHLLTRSSVPVPTSTSTYL